MSVRFISKEMIIANRAGTRGRNAAGAVEYDDAGSPRRWQFAPDFNLQAVTRDPGKKGVLAEFIGSGDFATQWVERQRYEVAAGRDEEPLLYEAIYDSQIDTTLPKQVTIYRIGPGGVVFEEIKEGGEVKFASVTESNATLPIRQYGVGLEYSKSLRLYNELWNVAIVERQAGVAYNALLNHIHLNPILTATYAAANQTAASTVGSTLVEKYMRTLENAIVAASGDTTNPRRGPYVLLVNTGQMYTVERMLNPVPQQGFTYQSSAIGLISAVVAYNGWVGTRGKKSTTYSGVTSGKAYLINTAFKFEDFLSRFKQPLEMAVGNPDISRFIEEQVVWDVHFGVYANPTAAVEEITWPTS